MSILTQFYLFPEATLRDKKKVLLNAVEKMQLENDRLSARLAEIENQAPVPAIPEGWISMKDRQPEPGQHCLFHVPLNGHPDYVVAGFIDDSHPDSDVYDLCGDTQGIDVFDIESWMPLTPPPKNKE